MSFKANETEEWEFRILQKRYLSTYDLELTLNQAKQVFEYEKLLTIPSKDAFFSMWEEYDFELNSLQEILTPEQFNIYQKKREEQLRLNEAQLIIDDQLYIDQLNSAKSLVAYYENELIGELEKQQQLILPILTHVREKVEYLKAEYKKYLNNDRKLILVNHFRHSRRFQPNLLNLTLTNHQLICLLPDYPSFCNRMDISTKPVAEFIETYLKKATEMLPDNFKDIFNSFKKVRQRNILSDTKGSGGWNIIIKENEQEAKGKMVMQVVLIDKEFYSL